MKTIDLGAVRNARVLDQDQRPGGQFEAGQGRASGARNTKRWALERSNPPSPPPRQKSPRRGMNRSRSSSASSHAHRRSAQRRALWRELATKLPNPIVALISGAVQGPAQPIRRATRDSPCPARAAVGAGAEGAAPERVLVIHSSARHFAPYNASARRCAANSTQQLGAAHRSSGGLARHRARRRAEGPASSVEYLVGRTRVTPPDLVIAIANPAMLLQPAPPRRSIPGPAAPGHRPRSPQAGRDQARRNRSRGHGDPGFPCRRAHHPGAAARHRHARARGRRLTARAVLGQGDRARVRAAWRSLRVLPAGILNLEQMRQRVAALPPDSAVFYQMFSVARTACCTRTSWRSPRSGSLRARRSSACSTTSSARASSAGRFSTLRETGRITAELAVRMLREPQRAGQALCDSQPPPTFDWRELAALGHPRVAAAAGRRGALPGAIALGAAPAADPVGRLDRAAPGGTDHGASLPARGPPERGEGRRWA